LTHPKEVPTKEAKINLIFFGGGVSDEDLPEKPP
jgi:hypothetical protein